jgi:hypothetical protein
MRALTVQQPWAWAIVHGGKVVENRTQAWGYRGPLAIHAGLARFVQNNLASATHRAAHGSDVPTEIKFGAIIGVADLVDVHVSWQDNDGPCCDSLWAQFAVGPTKPVVHLALESPRPLRSPIPAKGRLGLWTPDADLDAAIREQVPV